MAKHELDCSEISELDEINGDDQLAWVWCDTHQRYEWHSVPRWKIREGRTHSTDRNPVEW